MKKGNKNPEIVIEEISQFNQDSLFEHLAELKGLSFDDFANYTYNNSININEIENLMEKQYPRQMVFKS